LCHGSLDFVDPFKLDIQAKVWFRHKLCLMTHLIDNVIQVNKVFQLTLLEVAQNANSKELLALVQAAKTRDNPTTSFW
jgi:hypothetical protein